MTARPLFTALPDLRVPWMPLAHVPTPVEPCTAIADWLGVDAGRVHMKRDDLVSPIYGGNKVRRFEFLLADAKARGARRLVTVGGLASTQAIATAVFGRELGLPVRIVLFDQPLTRFAQDAVRTLVTAGAEVIHGGGIPRTVFRTLRLLERGDYVIFPGAASPLANLGYVDAMLELGEQVGRGEAPRPDLVIVPTGSSGTLAGLALGAAYLGWPTEIVGVRITAAYACNRLTVGTVVHRTDRFLAQRSRHWKKQRAPRWSIDGNELGEGYGFPTPAAREGASEVERLTGAPGEITYSGKALAALRRIVRARPDAQVLLWNTLSTPRPPIVADARIPRELAWMYEQETVA